MNVLLLGNPIPDKKGQLAFDNYANIVLADVLGGACYVVTRLFGSDEDFF
ncbi:MAG: hypothetical protein ACK5KP_06950 [Paludibacteraceae bacterium]